MKKPSTPILFGLESPKQLDERLETTVFHTVAKYTGRLPILFI